MFFLIIVFLYKTLDITKKSNDFFSSKVTNILNDNTLKKIIIEDISESSIVESISDKNKNTILQLQTSNMYHNIFFKHVTYFISKKKNLIRIESLKKFDKTKLEDEFFESTFIDILISEVQSFEVSQLNGNKSSFSVMIKKDKNNISLFGSTKF